VTRGEYKAKRSESIKECENLVMDAAVDLKREPDEFKRFQIMWALAWGKLRDLEEYRMPGGGRWEL
jgi:hypothetical protein